MNWSVALKLGRVSNLPTVWTNSLAALLLAGGTPLSPQMLPLLLAMSLFYIGGMYLNDAFDAEIDARERPERPIPSGQISQTSVFILGFGMLGAGLLVLLWLGLSFDNGGGIWPALSGVGLAAAVVAYDYKHKANPFSPLVMGLCRFMVYLSAALCVALPPPAMVWIGAGLLLCYLIGLTYIAKQENLGRIENLWPLVFLAAPVIYGAIMIAERPGSTAFFLLLLTAWIVVALYFLKRRQVGDIPRAVVSLIAGISLFDALLIIIATNEINWALLSCAGFLLTLALQRFIPGT